MAAYSPKLQALLAPVVASMGYELVGVERHGGSRSALLRVYIDRDGGVSVDDCAAVSHQVSGVLDVENPVSGHYTLEVSSPGLDRPLFLPAHFERFRGHKVRLKLLRPTESGSRKLTGEIRAVDGQTVRLDVDGNVYDLSLEQIDSARLVPQY